MAGAALGGAKLASPRRDLALGALEARFRESHRTCLTTVGKVFVCFKFVGRWRARATRVRTGDTWDGELGISRQSNQCFQTNM